MNRMLARLVLVAAVGLPAIAAADDPVERAAEKAADAKKDNKPKTDRPQREPTQANRPDAGQVVDDPLVQPRAAHGDKVIPSQTGAVRAHKRHHHHRALDTDKRLHDPTDIGNR